MSDGENYRPDFDRVPVTKIAILARRYRDVSARNDEEAKATAAALDLLMRENPGVEGFHFEYNDDVVVHLLDRNVTIPEALTGTAHVVTGTAHVVISSPSIEGEGTHKHLPDAASSVIIEPPGRAKTLIRLLAPPDRYDELSGDFEERFAKSVKVDGARAARFWAWREAIWTSCWLLQARLLKTLSFAVAIRELWTRLLG